MARYSMVVWYVIVEYCGLDTLILIKGRRRCQIFAQFETISEYINSSVEKALSLPRQIFQRLTSEMKIFQNGQTEL